MINSYQSIEVQFERLAQLDHAITFLQWDQLVMMPPGGNDPRAKSIAELATMHHELLSAPLLGETLLQALENEKDLGKRRSLIEMERAWKQAACLPSSLVKAKSLAGSKCEHGWRTQRQENDWPAFLANFKEVVQLSREEAQARQSSAADQFPTPYDALLDLYCTGDSSDFIKEVFIQLKRELPTILQHALDKQSQESDNLQGTYPIEAQQRLNRKLMEYLGFDFEAGRLDISMHPFSTGGRGDQRITTRFRENEFAEALLATAHETGHAGYESGLPQKWEGLPVGQARNMCIHESQSLLFEKQIFLSKPFISFFSQAIHEILPDTLALSSDSIWTACTKVQPSYIRVEADEVTYPLHVILRFEIESDLINGNIEAADIPDLWNEKMQKYLGLSTTGNFTDGCLQDIHWTDGSFGYFPSYTMGALNAAQLFTAICKNHPDWQEKLSIGDIGFIRQWLNTNVWSKGCTMDSQDIIKTATGEETNPQYYLDHLRNRYIEGKY
jgi:carboxypeptidase Taq